MEKKSSQKKWWIFLSVAAIFTAGVLLFFLYPKFDFARTWAADVLYAGAEPDITIDVGHGPVVQPDAQAPDDLSIRLHPERHVRRAARTIELEWNVTKDWRWPDGVGKEVYLINGEFPGSMIEVRSGDEVLVKVRNELAGGEGVWFHWHGLRVENDTGGVLGLTRCAVAANESYTYRLQIPVDVHGTFWYYSQVGTQRGDGLFGALVVHRPLDDSDREPTARLRSDVQEEQLLVINDWYHPPSETVLASYRDAEHFDAMPPPDSILLNGRGYFDCSKVDDGPAIDCQNTDIPHLTLPDRARVRIVNAGSLVGFTISTVGITMTLLAMDGSNAIERVTSEKIGILYPGQRMDVLFERVGRNEYESAWITIALDRKSMQYPNLALTDTQQFRIATSLVASKDAPEPAGTEKATQRINAAFLNLSNVRGTGPPTIDLEKKADSVVVLNVSTSHEGAVVGIFNGTSRKSRSLPQDYEMKNQKRLSLLVVQVDEQSVVDIVVNNLDSLSHVLHIDSHNFYVLDIAQGFYSAVDQDESVREMTAHLVEDTVLVPGHGYAVLRFRADRPGLWPLRSTILWDQADDMSMIFQVGPASDSEGNLSSKTCNG